MLSSHHTPWEGRDASHWDWIQEGRGEVTPVVLVEALESPCLSQRSMDWTTQSIVVPRCCSIAECPRTCSSTPRTGVPAPADSMGGVEFCQVVRYW